MLKMRMGDIVLEKNTVQREKMFPKINNYPLV